jgi:hypothetical protein
MTDYIFVKPTINATIASADAAVRNVFHQVQSVR